MVESLLEGQVEQASDQSASKRLGDREKVWYDKRLPAELVNLKFTSKELSYLKEFTAIVGSVPRTVKRFVNIYRMIRVHQDLKITPKNRNEAYLSLMFLIAIQN